MTSYFEKLTSINTSSLTSLHKQTKDSSQKSSSSGATSLSELSSTVEDLKRLNSKLELDLKCEHDEKADLVGLKVGLENEVVNLREVNERLEFQVEQLRVEKDKIHHVLAKFREDGGGSESRVTGLFIASSGSGAGGSIGGGGFGVMKKFPSLDDLSSPTSPLFTSPSTSPPPGLVRVTTPTSLASGGPLERITEEDETLLESLVLSNNSNKYNEPNASSSSGISSTKELLPQHQQPRMEDLLKKIAFLESENIRLTRKKFVCSKCKRRSNNGRSNPAAGLIFEDEGLVLSAIDDDDEEEDDDEDFDDGFDDDGGAGAGGRSSSTSSSSLVPAPKQSSSSSSDGSNSGVIKSQANSILEIQRKIIEKLERELSNVGGGLEEDNTTTSRRRTPGDQLSLEISRMKEELEKRMSGIVWIIANNKREEGGGEAGG